ncbi:MAG: ATP-binding protein [candidate division WOR-3 bacterium]
MKVLRLSFVFIFFSLVLLILSLLLKIKENLEIKKEAEELISLFEPSFESILNASYFIDELYYKNLDNLSDFFAPDLKEDSLLKIALVNNFYEITILDKNLRVISSTGRKKNSVIEKKVFEKGRIESIEGDSLFYLLDKGNYYILMIKDIRDLKEKKTESGLKKMLEKLSKEEKIEYISLESSGETVFSSKNIEPINDRDLIDKIINKNRILIQKRKIYEEEIIEVLKAFFFRNTPIGILRLGISLDRFRNRIFVINLILISGVFLFLFSLLLFILSFYERFKYFPSLILSDYSIYKIENNKFQKVYGKELNLSKLDFKDKRQILCRLNEDYYFAERDNDFIIFLKINEFMELFKESEKKREEEGILRILSSFAHEIKNPLNSLKLISYRLKDKIKEDYPEFEKALNSLTNSIEEFMNLLRPFYLKKERVKVKDFIESVIKKIEGDLKDNKIEVVIKGLNKELFFDLNQMEKVFLNLIRNAIEAQPEGGRIDIEVFEEKGRLMIKVKDYGIGIKRENLDRIFEPYFTTKKSGTGLGLFTVKRIIESHGFEISVNSEEGKGTEFIIKT